MDGHTVFGGERNEFKLTIQKWRQLLLVTAGTNMDSKVVVWAVSLLLLFGVVFFFLHFLVCAIRIHNSKVGKCRIACCNVLTWEKKRKWNAQFENAQSTHIGQEHVLPPFVWGRLPPCLFGNNRSRQSLLALKAQWGRTCFPIDLLPNSTTWSV